MRILKPQRPSHFPIFQGQARDLDPRSRSDLVSKLTICQLLQLTNFEFEIADTICFILILYPTTWSLHVNPIWLVKPCSVLTLPLLSLFLYPVNTFFSRFQNFQLSIIKNGSFFPNLKKKNHFFIFWQKSQLEVFFPNLKNIPNFYLFCKKFIPNLEKIFKFLQNSVFFFQIRNSDQLLDFSKFGNFVFKIPINIFWEIFLCFSIFSNFG